MENSLPKNWVETQLGEITSKPQYGWTTKSSDSGNLKYLRTTDIGKGKIKWKNVPFCIDLPDNIDQYLLQKNDILISRAGSIGLSYLVEDEVKNCLYASYLIRFKPYTNPKLISYYLHSHEYWKSISDNSIGIAVKNINAPKLQAIPFPLPPLAEQERIVAKLDKVFGQLELIESKINSIKELKDKFFASVFFNNSGNTTLEGLIEECKGRVGVGWKDFPKIGVSAKDGIINLSTGLKETFENYKVVMPGDIIYNTMRINIGSIAIYNGVVPAITSPDYVVLRTKGISNHLFINFIKSDLGRINLSSVTTGSVRSRLYFKNLITLSYPILDNKKQLQADNILEWFERTIKSLDLLSKNKLSFLKNSILNKAFKGELVPQLPTDGDAKDLLAEILALKNETKKKKK